MNENEEKIVKISDDKQNRRDFLKQITQYMMGLTFICPVMACNMKSDNISKSRYLHEAMYYSKMTGNKTKCLLCPNACILQDGRTGKCLIRKNIDGKLYTTDFGDVVPHPTEALDYSDFPLTAIWLPRLDIRGIHGCSLKCSFCFNGENIQANPESRKRTDYYLPEAIISEAKKMKSDIVCFSLNEPVINFEYTLAVAKLAKENNLKVLLTTGGYVKPEPFADLLQYVDIVFFSFKGFSNDSYQKYTKGDLKTVLTNLELVKKCHKKIEILYVVIPTISDAPEDIKAMSLWVKENLGQYTPVHFLRYWPSFKLKHLPQTSLESIKNALEIAQREGLKFALPFAHLAAIYDMREVIESNYLTLECPYCGSIVAKFIITKDDHIKLFQNFRKNYSCGTCGKDFLPIYM
jgi:pyruvate formate lyase activating enzyme